MGFTTAQKAKLNKMNRASQDVSLGTVVSGLVDGYTEGSASIVTLTAQVSQNSGSITTLNTNVSTLQSYSSVKATGSTVSAVQANASSVTIPTGLATVAGFIVQCRDASGSVISTINANAVSGGSIVIISASATYKINTGDFMRVIAW